MDTPARLLGAGYPTASVLFYPGGIHDWMTLGLPVRAASNLQSAACSIR